VSLATKKRLPSAKDSFLSPDARTSRAFFGSVEQPAPAAKPYITLLLPEGERKRLIDDIVDFVANK